MTSVSQAAEHSLAFTTIVRGDHSGIAAYREAVARTPSEWAEIWQRHTAGIRTPPPLPAVDFSIDMVIAVFFGKGPQGRRAAILNVVDQNNRRVVLLQMIGPPGPESEDAPQSTPFQIIRVPRTALPVVFVRAKIPDLYQPGR
jgi:hypothetical protein